MLKFHKIMLHIKKSNNKKNIYKTYKKPITLKINYTN